MSNEKVYQRHHRYKSMPHRQYAYLIGRCRQNQTEITITLEQYEELRKQPCHYCGHALPPTGYCLDRKDAVVGYTPENTVPCCTVCNFTKHSIWSYNEYREIAVVVSKLLDTRLQTGVTSTFPHDHRKHHVDTDE
jgi:hypothetical protein